MNTQIIVPGIGFPQSISVGANASHPETLREPTPCRRPTTNMMPLKYLRGPYDILFH